MAGLLTGVLGAEPHNEMRSGSVLFSLPGRGGWGVKSNPSPGSSQIALGSSLSVTYPDFDLCPGPWTSPGIGRKEGISIPAVSPLPPSRPQGPRAASGRPTRGTRPLYPSRLCPPFPASGPQPGTAGAHQGQESPSVPQPHPLSARPESGPQSPGRTVPGGGGRSREATESAGRSPGPSPSGVGDSGTAVADGRV